jgi:hypothetical protein
MKIANRILKVRRYVRQCLLAGAIFAVMGVSLVAQQPPASGPSGPEVQREAMRKLAFLAGHWSGPISVSRGPGEPVKLTQTEEVQYKLDGLVMLIEGTSRDSEGKTSFNALATIAFDDATHNYRFRAYNGGHYIDTELTVTADGFSWSYDAGPAHVVNTMHLTGKGEWSETTDVTVGGNPPHHSVEMLLQHRQ